MSESGSPGSTVFGVCAMNAIFDDVAECLTHGLHGLGRPAQRLSAGLLLPGRNIILGAQLVGDWSGVPDDTILFNFEQLGVTSPWITDAYLERLRRHTVWDYSPRNIEWLRRTGINPDARLVRLGYAPALTRIPPAAEQDIDVLFVGTVSDRRRHVLEALLARGLRVEALQTHFGTELDAHVARARLVLNLHLYDTRIFEVVRVGPMLANRKAVVSEVGPDTEIEDDLRGAVLGVPYEGLVDACLALLADEPRRHALEETGFAVFTARRQADFLRAAVEALPAPAAPLPTRINLGSGKSFMPDAFNIDISGYWRPDIVADIADPALFAQRFDSRRFGRIAVPRGHFTEVIAQHVLEHIPNLAQAMSNILDMLAEGGALDIAVPYDLSFGAWQDPTHVRAFNEQSWLYYTSWFWYMGWTEARFDLVRIEPVFSDHGRRLLAGGMDLESVTRMPRAVDELKLLLRKRALTPEEREKVRQYLARD